MPPAGREHASSPNVELVRRIYEAVARRDTAAVFELYDADVEFDSSRLPEAALGGLEHSHGHAGLRSIFERWAESWASFEDRCEELLDAGDHVVSVVTREARGRASGIEASARRAGVWTIRDGKVVRVVWFTSVEEARAAAGLA
jgi:ketosteroid isomerase-like protein